MSLINDPDPRPYDFLTGFLLAAKEAGLDGPAIFDEYFVRHHVIKGPDFLLMGQLDPERPDAWLVMWAEIHPTPTRPLAAVGLFLDKMPHHLPYVGWCRYLKNRREVVYYSTARLLKLTSRVR